MTDSLVTAVVHFLSGMFLVGTLGCAFAIPIVAYKMFAVLFARRAGRLVARLGSQPFS